MGSAPRSDCFTLGHLYGGGDVFLRNIGSYKATRCNIPEGGILQMMRWFLSSKLLLHASHAVTWFKLIETKTHALKVPKLCNSPLALIFCSHFVFQLSESFSPRFCCSSCIPLFTLLHRTWNLTLCSHSSVSQASKDKLLCDVSF
jgi:hypothetical protein